MADLIINPEYKDQVMSHGDVRAKALSDHTQEELLSLALKAKNSGNPVLLRCFTSLPDLSDLRADKVAGEVAKIAPKVVPVDKKPVITSPTKEETDLLTSIQP